MPKRSPPALKASDRPESFSLGPVVTGFLDITENWRWAFYVLLWLSAITAIPIFTIPETYSPVLLLHKAQRIRRAKVTGFEHVQAPVEASGRTAKQIFKVTLTRPWLILCDPIASLVAIYLSMVYALLYMQFTIYPIVSSGLP